MKRKTLIDEILTEFSGGALPGTWTASQLSVVPNEEEAEEMGGGNRSQPGRHKVAKIDRARVLFKSLISDPKTTRTDIIAAFEQQLSVTNSTAISYFQRLAKEAGLTNMGSDDETDEMIASPDESPDNSDPELQLPDEELDINDAVPDSGDPNRQGVIRVVQNAHLVYKRENEEGTYDELWVYNTNTGLKDELGIRRNILAGTDIPPRKTKSDDGRQSFVLTTMGNAQLLQITGLPQ